MAPLNIPREVQRRLIEELGGALDARIALPLLLADREECHAWISDAKDVLREDLTHMRVLIQILCG